MSVPIIKNGKFNGDFEFKYSKVIKSNVNYKEVTFKLPIDISESQLELYADKLKSDFLDEFND